jgi:hypothetical protein
MPMFLVMLMAPAAVVLHGQEGQNGQSTAFTIDGNAALWTVAIKPDRTQDFESVMTKLRDALRKSEKPERQQQAAGWELLKVEKPMPDGNIAYVHVINPVVPGADYTILRILYDEFPDERQALYEQYRGAFVKSLSLASGAIVVDLSPAP